VIIRGLSIRSGRVDERHALEELQRRASLEYSEYRQKLLDNPDIIELPRAHLADGQVRVAEADGRVLGFSVVLPRGAGMFQLDGLFVEPGQWGRGIGKALVGAECKRLAAQGGGRLEVVANPRAEGFYEKLGFAVAGGVITMFGPSRRMVLETKDFSPLPR
jgi:GNAT superfamily N-acetyltransferase